MPQTTVQHVRDYSLKNEDAVYIGRTFGGFKGEGFGNPFVVKKGILEKGEAVKLYKEWLLDERELPSPAPHIIKHTNKEILTRIKNELKEKVLLCWCKPDSCHGDVIAEIVNKEEA